MREVGLRGGEGVLEKAVRDIGSGSVVGVVRLGWLDLMIGAVVK